MSQFHIYYSGSVQGVGFRYTCQRLAQQYNVKGWVKNLSDGRVELTAQADASTLQNFLKQIDEHFKGYITDRAIKDQPSDEIFKDFQIRR